jgi:hypothetical protein
MARPAKLDSGFHRVPVQLEPADLERLDLVVRELTARTGTGDRARAVRWAIRAMAQELRSEAPWIDCPPPPE